MLRILLSNVYFCYCMPYAILLLLLPSLEHLPLLICTFIILNIQYFWSQHYIFYFLSLLCILCYCVIYYVYCAAQYIRLYRLVLLTNCMGLTDFLSVKCVCVCVVDGWFMQPHLCVDEANRCAQVGLQPHTPNLRLRHLGKARLRRGCLHQRTNNDAHTPQYRHETQSVRT